MVNNINVNSNLITLSSVRTVFRSRVFFLLVNVASSVLRSNGLHSRCIINILKVIIKIKGTIVIATAKVESKIKDGKSNFLSLVQNRVPSALWYTPLSIGL